jgi:hypothetical protein
MEYMPRTKNTWHCGIHENPQPVLDWQPAQPSHPANDGPYVTKDIYTSKLGFGEPSNGDASSDTVKELQHRLNRIPLRGGVNLPITGKYLDMTEAEVCKWQEQICRDTPDPVHKSYLGPSQRAKMFPANIYTIHDDGLPHVAG